jgi:CopG family nickel-responsive transcriptional regulator
MSAALFSGSTQPLFRLLRIYAFINNNYGVIYKYLDNNCTPLTIVSVSLNDDILTEIDKLQKTLGFAGRSEIVRAGIRNLLAEEKDRQNLSGSLFAVVLAVHDEKSDEQVTEMRHDYDKLIGTYIHNKIDGDKCLEIFLLKGEADEIREQEDGSRKADFNVI